MKKCLFVIIAILTAILYTSCSNFKSESFEDIISKPCGEYKVVVRGFMSPVVTDNYFYLTKTPYAMPQGAIPTYLKVSNEQVKTVYTNQYIQVEGDLLVLSENKFKDTMGYSTDRRIINATVKIVENPENEAIVEYNRLAQTGIYEDLYMYYGMLDMLVSGGVPKEEIQQINEEEFNSMILMLAVSGITDNCLADIIDKEAGLIKEINAKIKANSFDFAEYTDRTEELKNLLGTYFEKVLDIESQE